MKRQYIKPTTAHIKTELQHLMVLSGPKDEYNDGDVTYSKEFDFVTEGEQAWKNEYPAFSLWED